MVVVMADRCVVVYTRWRIVAYGCGVDVAYRGYVVHYYGCWLYHFNHLYGCWLYYFDHLYGCWCGYVVHYYGCWLYHFNHLYRCWLYNVHYWGRGCYLVDNHRCWCGYRYVRAYGWYGYCC